MKIRITLLVLCLALSALATEVSLEPLKDACVCDCAPGANNPIGPEYLGQGRYSNCYTRTFIQWDMNEIPDGATIDSAIFRIYVGQFYGSPSGEMAYYRVIEDWNENTITYLNMPDYTDTGAVFLSNWPGSGTWHTIDVTDSVVAWYDSTIDNYGLYCHSRNSTSTSDCMYASSRYPTHSLRPELVVNYSGGSEVQEETWGSIKEGFDE